MRGWLGGDAIPSPATDRQMGINANNDGRDVCPTRPLFSVYMLRALFPVREETLIHRTSFVRTLHHSAL